MSLNHFAYSSISRSSILILCSDAYFNLLLRRLNTERSPSFHNYALPPRTVLDLGCGQGIWVQEAAAAWAEAGTKIVGFDLVDLVSEITKLSPSTYWKRGNLCVNYSRLHS